MAAAAHPGRVVGLALYAASARLRADTDYAGLHDTEVDALVDGFRQTWASEDAGGGIEFVAPSVAHDQRWRSSFVRIQRRGSTPRGSGILAAEH